jgi:CBS domain-containing protein
MNANVADKDQRGVDRTQPEGSRAHSQALIFRRIVRDHMRPAPATIGRGASVADAVNRMAQTSSSAVLVTDAADRPIGIITEQDVVRRIAWRAAPDDDIEQIMTSPVVTVDIDDYLYRAIAVLRRHKLRHIPVVDGQGALVGMLSLHEALQELAGPAMQLIDKLTHDETLDGMRYVKAAELDMVETLLGDDVPVPEVQKLLSDLNADLHRRALRRTIAEMTSDGWSEPPVAFALIIMGSGGRGESFLAPDQDNGFILADYDDADHGRIDAYFVAVADRFTRMLDAIGFPLCKGYVMATNPVWRKRLSEWRVQFATWMRQRSEAQLLLTDILFDFSHAGGDPSLSNALRSYITETARNNRAFVRDLFTIEADHGVALGWFGQLRKETGDRSQPGMINLKLRGTLPLVEGARLLALRAGIAATSTLLRLEGLAERRAITRLDHIALAAAFEFIATRLLRQQVADLRQGREPGDFIAEASLGRRERDELVAHLRAIDNFRSSLRSEFTGSAF